MQPMEGDRSKRAIARIEDALARIEAAAGHFAASPADAPPQSNDEELAALRERHERLRSAVVQSLEQIDAMIEGRGA